MSKLAFISDIHGNLPALESVWLDICQRGVDKIFCLGDLVGYYSQINEVISFIRRNSIPCVMGNHDYAIAYNNGIIERSKTCTNVLKKQLSYLSTDNLFFLRTLPMSLIVKVEAYNIWCLHGGIFNPIDDYFEINHTLLNEGISGINVLITAHTHIPLIKKSARLYYANCGSVGQPRDHNPQASYLLIDGDQFEIVRVNYDIHQTIYMMKKSGFPDYISSVLLRGCRIGE